MEKLPVASRLFGAAELGWRGYIRFWQTALAVSPRIVRCLVNRRRPRPAEVRELFETLGATYIKFGSIYRQFAFGFPP
jgi:aarF domain-containing kinase